LGRLGLLGWGERGKEERSGGKKEGKRGKGEKGGKKTSVGGPWTADSPFWGRSPCTIRLPPFGLREKIICAAVGGLAATRR